MLARVLLYVWFLECHLVILYVVIGRLVPGGLFIRSQGLVFFVFVSCELSIAWFCLCVCMRFCVLVSEFVMRYYVRSIASACSCMCAFLNAVCFSVSSACAACAWRAVHPIAGSGSVLLVYYLCPASLALRGLVNVEWD